MKDKRLSNGIVAILMVALIVLAAACTTPAAAPVTTVDSAPTLAWSELWTAYQQGADKAGDTAAADLLVEKMKAPTGQGSFELIATSDSTYIVKLAQNPLDVNLLPLKDVLGEGLYVLNNGCRHWFFGGEVKAWVKLEGLGSSETNLQVGNILEVN